MALERRQDKENFEKCLNALITSASSDSGNMKAHLVLLSKTADSISDGDLVDREIRSRQNWSLLPTQVTEKL